MHISRSMMLAISLLAGLMSPLAAQAADCPEGKVANEFTRMQCCWPGQAWNGERCVGAPSCPPGLMTTANGEDCARPQTARGVQLKSSGAGGRVPLKITGEEGLPIFEVLDQTNTSVSVFSSAGTGFGSGFSQTERLLCKVPCELEVDRGQPLMLKASSSRLAYPEIIDTQAAVTYEADGVSHGLLWPGILSLTVGALAASTFFLLEDDQQMPALGGGLALSALGIWGIVAAPASLERQ